MNKAQLYFVLKFFIYSFIFHAWVFLKVSLSIDISNGLVLISTRPLYEHLITKICDTIYGITRPQWVNKRPNQFIIVLHLLHLFVVIPLPDKESHVMHHFSINFEILLSYCNEKQYSYIFIKSGMMLKLLSYLHDTKTNSVIMSSISMHFLVIDFLWNNVCICPRVMIAR